MRFLLNLFINDSSHSKDFTDGQELCDDYVMREIDGIDSDTYLYNFFNAEGASRKNKVVISGGYQCGKTQLVIKFCKSENAKKKYSKTIWFKGHSGEEILEKLDLKKKDKENGYKTAKDHLSTENKTLLVFDGLFDDVLISQIIADNTSCDVIVVSQDTIVWNTSNYKVININQMSNVEAYRFLEIGIQNHNEYQKQQCQKILRKITVSNWILYFRNRIQDGWMMSNIYNYVFEPEPLGNADSAPRVEMNKRQQIEVLKQDTAVYSLLSILAYFNHARIPISWLQELVPEISQVEFIRAREKLKTLGIIEIVTDNVDEPCIKIDFLFQRFIYEQHARDKDASYLLSVCKFLNKSPETIHRSEVFSPFQDRYLPYIKYLYKVLDYFFIHFMIANRQYYTPANVTAFQNYYVKLRIELGLHYFMAGKYAKAKKYFLLVAIEYDPFEKTLCEGMLAFISRIEGNVRESIKKLRNLQSGNKNYAIYVLTSLLLGWALIGDNDDEAVKNLKRGIRLPGEAPSALVYITKLILSNFYIFSFLFNEKFVEAKFKKIADAKGYIEEIGETWKFIESKESSYKALFDLLQAYLAYIDKRYIERKQDVTSEIDRIKGIECFIKKEHKQLWSKLTATASDKLDLQIGLSNFNYELRSNLAIEHNTGEVTAGSMQHENLNSRAVTAGSASSLLFVNEMIEKKGKILSYIFESLLKYLAKNNISKNSPSIFLMYAHDSKDKAAPAADAGVARTIIDWLHKTLGLNLFSDRSPYGNRLVAVSSLDCERSANILKSQLCILPGHEYSVDYVIVCGSTLFGHYVDSDFYEKYDTAITSPSVRIREKKNSYQLFFNNLIIPISKFWHDDNFHHVMTESILLKIRINTPNFDSTVIPILLHGESKEALPSFITPDQAHIEDFKWREAKDYNGKEYYIDQGLYSGFFKLLLRLFADEAKKNKQVIIQECQQGYEECLELLQQDKLFPNDLDAILSEIERRKASHVSETPGTLKSLLMSRIYSASQTHSSLFKKEIAAPSSEASSAAPSPTLPVRILKG